MGRSRGGLTTKIHAMVDAQGLPISLVLSEGQAYHGHSAHLMLDGLPLSYWRSRVESVP